MSISVVNIVIIDDIQRLVIKQKHVVTINTVDLNEMIYFSGLFLLGHYMGMFLFADAFYSKTLQKNCLVVQIYHCNFQTYCLDAAYFRSKISINGA